MPMEEERQELNANLEAFKESLRAEYRKRIEELRAEYEEELSDAALKRRQEIELQVARMRDNQEKEYQKVLEEAREHILAEMRHRVSSFTNQSVGLALDKIKERIISLRSTPESYGPLLQDLVAEALEVLDEPAVVIVDAGESAIPLKHPLVESVEEEALDRWGGCMVMDAATRTRLVDNTLKTRWERAEKSLRFLLSESFHEVFEILERRAQQLRVS